MIKIITFLLVILTIFTANTIQDCIVAPNNVDHNQGYYATFLECAKLVNNTPTPTIYFYGNQTITVSNDIYFSTEILTITSWVNPNQVFVPFTLKVQSNFFLRINSINFDIVVENLNFISTAGANGASSAFILNGLNTGNYASISSCSFSNFTNSAIVSESTNIYFYQTNATNNVGSNCGVINAYTSTVEINGGVFSHNTGSYSGGVACGNYILSSAATYIGNSAYIGAVFYSNYTTSLSSEYYLNNAQSSGGVTYSLCNTSISYQCVYLVGNNFERNTATYGGVVHTFSMDQTTITNNTFNANTAYYGGALYLINNYYPYLTNQITINLTSSFFINNRGSEDGGSIYSFAEGVKTIFLGGDFYGSQSPSYPLSTFPQSFYADYSQVVVTSAVNCPTRPRIHDSSSQNITCFGVVGTCDGFATVNTQGQVVQCTGQCGCSSGSSTGYSSGGTYTSGSTSGYSSSGYSSSGDYDTASATTYSSSSANTYSTTTAQPYSSSDSASTYSSGTTYSTTTTAQPYSSSDSATTYSSGNTYTTSQPYSSSDSATAYSSGNTYSSSATTTTSSSDSASTYSSGNTYSTTDYSSGTTNSYTTNSPYTTSWSIISTGWTTYASTGNTVPPTQSPSYPPNTSTPPITSAPPSPPAPVHPTILALVIGIFVLICAVVGFICIIKHIFHHHH